MQSYRRVSWVSFIVARLLRWLGINFIIELYHGTLAWNFIVELYPGTLPCVEHYRGTLLWNFIVECYRGTLLRNFIMVPGLENNITVRAIQLLFQLFGVSSVSMIVL